MANIGDIVSIKTDKEVIEGTFVNNTEDSYVLKLASGYNIGISKNKVKGITIIQHCKEQKEIHNPIAPDNSLPTITILHTGGTIASKVDYSTGAVVAKFSPNDIIESVPQLKNIANIKSRFISNIQSESMRFGHYNLLIDAIEKEIKLGCKGIIITHGTDTLHYTSAALSFALENIPLPVILVGAQRSSDRGSADGPMNLVCAANLIAKTDFKGVAICMHSSISDDTCYLLPPTKTRKLHTTRRDAFKPVNAHPIAEITYPDGNVKFFTGLHNNKNNALRAADVNDKDAPKFHKYKTNLKIGILKTHTNMYPEDYAYYSSHDALVLEGTGLGHAQTTAFDDLSSVNADNMRALADICKKTVVVMTSQCIFGRVNMNVYSPQRALIKIGVISGEDMTTETAFIKLAYLLSNYAPSEVRTKISENLCGEISDWTSSTSACDIPDNT